MRTRIFLVIAMMAVPFLLPSSKIHRQSESHVIPRVATTTWGTFASGDRPVFADPRTVNTPVVPVMTTTTVGPPAPPVTTSTTTTEAPPISLTDATSVDTPDWQCIGWHESRNNYDEVNGGRWQFEDGTFESVTADMGLGPVADGKPQGLSGPAENYSPTLQDEAALALYAEALRTYGDGFHPWTTRWVCGL